MAIQETSAVSSAAANGKHGHALISDQKFHQLYALALDLRRAAEAGMAPLEGCEAALAGVSVCLVPGDVLISECASSLFDSDLGMSGLQHTLQVSPATGDSIVTALSTAVADRMKRNHRVTVLFLREEAGGLLLNEARAVAAGAKLPVIFMEQGSGDRAVSRRARAKKLSAPDDLISIPVDAQDVIAMYRVAHESIARARHGNGPTRIVCLSPRAAGVRSTQFNGKDVVARLEEWLTARRLPVQEWRQQIMAERNQRNSVEWQESSGREEIPQNAA